MLFSDISPFPCKKAAHLLFPRTPEAKFDFSSLHIPDVCEKKDGDPGQTSSPRSEHALKALGSKPCQ